MGSNFDLSPVAGGRSDPNERIFQRLAELDTRLLAIERRRDLIVTHINFTDTYNDTFEWSGGRAFMLYMGRGVTNVNNGTMIIDIYLNGNGSVLPDLRSALNGTVAITGQWVNVGAMSYQVSDASNIAVGTNTLSGVAAGAGPAMSPWEVHGLVIEWAQE